ncbi:MAG: hypothetical protein PUB21_12100 [Bacteroidales bacterium]|nr:hypothetical protein [Bacteroidales bacterium]
MKRILTYLPVLLIVALFTLLPSTLHNSFEELRLSNKNNKTEQSGAFLEQHREVPVSIDLLCKEPFVKQETDRGNKLPTLLRTFFRKINVSLGENEAEIPYRVITQYRCKHLSMLRNSNYYLYTLCRIII